MARSLSIALLLLLAGCGGSDAGADASDASTDADGACGTIPPVNVTGAGLTVDEATGGLIDEHGRDLVMRGINCGGRAKWAPFMPFLIDGGGDLAAIRSKADSFFARMVEWGLDTVRLTFSWEALEPEKGKIDQGYLDRYETMVDSAWDLGIRVIVDFHQDVFASPLCGDGFPAWTLPSPLSEQPPHHDCPDWGFFYVIDPDVQNAFDRFWADEDGIQTAFAAMWDVMLARFADHPGVVGYEVINEPGWGSASDLAKWKDEVLTPFHAKMISKFRAADPDALVFYDNTGADAVTGETATYPRPDGNGIVFGPHYYDYGIFTGGGWSGNPPEPVIDRMAEFMSTQKAHVLLGEFGIHGEADDGSIEWLTRVMAALDDRRVSATLWEYSINDEKWNGEDLSVVGPDGKDRPNLDVFVRPWLRAVAGKKPSFAWDPSSHTAKAGWTASEGVTEIRLPPRLFPNGPEGLVVEGEGACHTWDPDRGEIRVTAPAGTGVEVTFGL